MLDETSVTKRDSNEVTGSEHVPTEFHAGDKQQTNSTIIIKDPLNYCFKFIALLEDYHKLK